jgi:hypothetical protein
MRAKPILWAVLLLVAGLAVAMSVGAAGASTRAGADQSWTDPVGDAQGGAPDITAVTVSNDAAGTIRIAITVPMTEEMSTLVVHMDTNLNGKFDDPTDAYLAMASLGPGTAIGLLFKDEPMVSPTATRDVTSSTVTYSFPKAAANIDKAFAFWIYSQSAAQLGTDQTGDDMPDGTAVMTYVLAAPTAPATTTTAPTATTATTTTPTAPPAIVKPVISSAVATAAVAGKRMTVRFTVTRSDNGQPLTSGKMVCDPSVAGKVIPHVESFKAGQAKLSFTVPKTAKGKQLKVKLTIKAGTKSATKIATFRIS